jgi:hypothetical protein
MIKINFPADKKERKAMEERFFNALLANFNEAIINNHITGLIYKGENINLRRILTASFDDLTEIKQIIEASFLGNVLTYESFCNEFSYDNQRITLYNFFIDEDIRGNISLHSCYYCNLDFINIYDSISGYCNKVDFLNRARKDELLSISGIGIKTIEKIFIERNQQAIRDLSLNFLSPAKRKSVINYKFIQKKGIFTLDHFYPQHSFQMLSTSLYNLIPSCSPCNSRFKHAADFIIGKNSTYLSPSSDNYVLEEFEVFTLLFRSGKNIGNVKSINDINLIYDGYMFGQEEYIELFNIPARYSFHMKEALKLILKFQKYPKSYIKEIERTLKKSISGQTIEKDLFGEDLYEKSSNKPLSKLRRDIAKQIGLIE